MNWLCWNVLEQSESGYFMMGKLRPKEGKGLTEGEGGRLRPTPLCRLLGSGLPGSQIPRLSWPLVWASSFPWAGLAPSDSVARLPRPALPAADNLSSS